MVMATDPDWPTPRLAEQVPSALAPMTVTVSLPLPGGLREVLALPRQTCERLIGAWLATPRARECGIERVDVAWQATERPGCPDQPHLTVVLRMPLLLIRPAVAYVPVVGLLTFLIREGFPDPGTQRRLFATLSSLGVLLTAAAAVPIGSTSREVRHIRIGDATLIGPTGTHQTAGPQVIEISNAGAGRPGTITLLGVPIPEGQCLEDRKLYLLVLATDLGPRCFPQAQPFDNLAADRSGHLHGRFRIGMEAVGPFAVDRVTFQPLPHGRQCALHGVRYWIAPDVQHSTLRLTVLVRRPATEPFLGGDCWQIRLQGPRDPYLSGRRACLGRLVSYAGDPYGDCVAWTFELTRDPEGDVPPVPPDRRW